MNAARRNRTWKRLRFWGGIFLVVIVGIGILAYITYRKALGPPPTPPGKSSEFDQHLADIDKDWLFVFSREEKVVVADIYGNELASFGRAKETSGVARWPRVSGGTASPDGSRASVLHYRGGSGMSPPNALGISIIDLRSLEARTVEVDPLLYGRFAGDVWWLDENTLLVPFVELRYPNPKTGSGSETTQCLRVDIRNLGKPEAVELPIDTRWFRSGHAPAFDEDDGVLFFSFARTPMDIPVLKAYDSGGLHTATSEEKTKFRERKNNRDEGDEPHSPGGPPIEVIRVDRQTGVSIWISKLLKTNPAKRAIVLDGEIVRVSRTYLFGLGGTGLRLSDRDVPFWDKHLGLFVWIEGFPEVSAYTYFMDGQGRYRQWCEGVYQGKIPRPARTTEEAGEQ